MLYQTHSVLNMSIPVSKYFIDRHFHRTHPALDKFLVESVANGALPKQRHALDRMWVDDETINIVLTWNNRPSADNFAKLWASLNSYSLLSIQVITLDEDRV